MAEPKYKLTYFDMRGLAEPIRFIFAIAGVDYEDVRVAKPLTPEMKDELPFGKVPILEFDGKTLSQSHAIMRYLAKQFNLTGKDDFESAKCDEVVGGIMDFQREYNMAVFVKNPEEKATAMKDFLDRIGPLYMSKLEKFLTLNGGKYYVGSSVTWVDLYMLHFVQISQDLFPKQINQFPAMIKAADGILALPQIKEWVEKRPKTER